MTDDRCQVTNVGRNGFRVVMHPGNPLIQEPRSSDTVNPGSDVWEYSLNWDRLDSQMNRILD